MAAFFCAYMTKLVFILPLVLIVVAINFSVNIGFGIYDLHRALQLLCVVFILASCAFSSRVASLVYVIGSQQARAIRALSLFAMIFIGLSIIGASYPIIAAKGGGNDFLLVFAIVILAIHGSNNVGFVYSAVAYFGLAGLLVYYFQFFIGYFAGVVSGTSIEREVLVHHFSNIRFLNHIQVLFFPFIFALSVESDNRLVRNLAVVISILTISILFLLSARAGLGSLSIAALVVFVFFKEYRSYIKSFLWVLVVGFLCYLMLLKGIPMFFLGGEDVPVRVSLHSSGRWGMWVESLELIRNNWLLGVGVLHYSFVSSSVYAHPHNLILQVGLEYGVAVLTLLALLVIKLSFMLYRKLSRIGSAEVNSYFPFVWSVVAAIGMSMFSGVWVAPLTQLLLVICLAPLIGLLIEDCLRLPSFFELSKHKVGSLFVKVIVIFTVLGLLLLVYPDVKARIEGGAGLDPVRGVQVYSPRFWQEDVWPEK